MNVVENTSRYIRSIVLHHIHLPILKRTAVHLYDKYFPTIGIRRPMPKALDDTRNTGAV